MSTMNYPQQQYGSQQQVGQMGGATSGGQGMGQQMGARLQDVETPQQRTALDGVQRAMAVCGWCADQCIQHGDTNMAECIRLCEDVVELGETVLALVPRNSRYAATTLQAFQQAARECAHECSYHRHAHCQECAQMLGGVTEATQSFLASFGQQGGQIGQ